MTSLFPTPNLLLVQGRWSTEEDAALLEAVEKHGKCWSVVAKDVPGRTGHQCAKRYNYALDSSIRKRAIFLRDPANR